MTLQSSDFRLLSQSTSGRGVQIVATSTPGTALHTATSLSTAFDQLYLYAANVNASACKLTIEFGGAADSDKIVRSIDGQDAEELLVSGRPLNGGVVVKAFASTASVVNIGGYVIRVTSE